MRRSALNLVHCLMVSLLLATGIGSAEVVRMEHGHLEVAVDDAPEGNGFVYTVAGSKYSDPVMAAKGLEYIYARWPGKNPPTLEYACNTKRNDPGIDRIEVVVDQIGKRKDVMVILRPPPRGAIPESLFTAATLLKQLAEQDGGGNGG